MQKKAIFIDKDGTLIPDIPYNVNPDLITLSEGAENLKQLQELGFILVVITNQGGVARGYFEEDKLKSVELNLIKLLQESHVQLHGFFYCPHHPQGTVQRYSISCECRKPGNKMLLDAAKTLNIDLQRSWMIGDILNDVEAGNISGCKTILIDNGGETEWKESPDRIPLFKAKNLKEACDFIIETESIAMV